MPLWTVAIGKRGGGTPKIKKNRDREVLLGRAGTGSMVDLKPERWRAVPDAPGYMVSDLGRVTGPRGWVLKAKTSMAVLEAFVGPRPPGLECRHLDGNPANSVLANLAWGTHSENMQDRVRHGTHNKTRRTHCPRGHPLRLPNLQPSEMRRGRRTCLACSRALSAHWYAAQRGRILDLQAVSDQYYKRIGSG
jgi:hypothetical protein